MKRLCIIFLAVAGLSLTADNCFAQRIFEVKTDTAPPQVQNAMDQYRDSGADAAWTTLSKGSTALENDASTREQLGTMVTKYGKVERWTEIATLSLARAWRQSYYLIGYQTGVAYIEVIAYQAPDGWIVTQMSISDNYRDVIPEYVLRMN